LRIRDFVAGGIVGGQGRVHFLYGLWFLIFVETFFKGENMSQTHFNMDGLPVFAGCFAFVIIGLLSLVVVAFTVWLFCRIFTKAGYSWAFGLLVLVPLGQLIVLLILAFGQWPIHQQMQILHDQANSG
jgi:hypothetical protein